MAIQSLISASYSDAITVNFTHSAWFNATTVAAPFGKTPKDWLRTDDTKAYIDAIRRICLIEENQLLNKRPGAPSTGGGTWMHPKLAIPFARWLNPDFGVWCDMQIEKILHERTPYGLRELPPIATKKALPGCLTTDQQDAIKAMVKARAETIDDPKKRAAVTISMWSAIGTKFGVRGQKNGYKNIPAEQFTEVLSLVARVPLEGEHIPSQPLPQLAKTYHYPRNLLEQEWFKTDKIPACLSIDMLGDTTRFASPLFAMLNEMRIDGHDVSAPWDEAVAMREAIQRADKSMEEIGMLIWTARFKPASTSGKK